MKKVLFTVCLIATTTSFISCGDSTTTDSTTTVDSTAVVEETIDTTTAAPVDSVGATDTVSVQ